MTTALQVANWFLASIDREAGDSITHLKLQKLLYYAQAWSLALREKELFSENAQAWAHGPVFESVYQEFRGQGWEALPAPLRVPELNEEDEEFLQEILDVYGDFSAKHLEMMTHREAPWVEARCGLPPEARSNAVVSKQRMAEYYQGLFEGRDGEEQS